MEKRKYAVIGDPIKHSMSPQMHNAAFEALGIDAEYSAIHVKKDDLAKFADHAKKELAGFNVTVPHKNAIIPYLDGISDLCSVTGSVNTVKVDGGKLIGDSTDGYGMEMAIKEAFNIDLKGNSFLFIGCGGTVKAVSYYFITQGADKLFIANRTVATAEKLSESLTNSTGKDVYFSALNDIDRLTDFTEQADVIIQATSLGLKSDDPSPFPENLIQPGTAMFDTIYKNTSFLRNAAKHNAPFADGSMMLVHQGAKAFSIWTGQDAPIEEMRKAVSS